MDIVEKNNKADINRHPWEIARAESILKILKKNSPNTKYADIGSGDQFFTRELVKYTNVPIYAVDINFDCISSGKTDKVIQYREISDIPKESIDCIILMDVLEHIKEDAVFLKSILNLLKNDGELIITVPAHDYLFSRHDIFLKHYRRYNNVQLVKLFRRYNLIIKENFYFYILPFAIRCFQIMLLKLGCSLNMNKCINNWRFKEHNILTRFIVKMLDLDFYINRYLKRFGIILTGLSLCFVCQKADI